MPTVRSRYPGATALFGPWLIDSGSASWTSYDAIRGVSRTLTAAGVTQVSLRPVEPQDAHMTVGTITPGTFTGDH